MKLTQNELNKAIRVALLGAGVAGLGMSFSAFAQDDDKEEAKEMETVVVTGSRLKSANTEGALPVTTITREDIEMSGQVSVAALLRESTFNSFGSLRPQSGNTAQGVSEVSLRGLGSQRTLVLIDGRRTAKSPFTGSASDLNTIPLGSVERIEILRDGASAVYGSDAIGGVVNVITRKDFNGAQFSYGVGRPTREGGETEEASAIFGISGDRGSMTGGASTNTRGIVFTRERPWGTTPGLSTFGNNYRVANAAGTGQTGPRLPLPGFACNSNGFFFTAPGASNNICSFDFNLIAADDAKVKTTGAFVRGELEINEDWQTYMKVSVGRSESFGRYAPVPGEVFVPSDTPNDPVPGDGRGAFVRHRFAAAGNRDVTQDSTNSDFLAGIQGRAFDLLDVDFGVRATKNKGYELGRGYIVGAIAEQFIADGSYSLSNPFGNSQDVLNSIQATITRDTDFNFNEAFASVGFDLFEMANGTANAIVGAEYRDEFYNDKFDPLSEGGQILGSAGNSSGASRNVTSVYAEALFPLLDTLELDVAGRYESYSDYGSDFAPKLALRYQPLENLTLRASWGQGFAAPTLDLLAAKPAFSADSVNDPQTCAAFGGTPAQCADPTTTIQVNSTRLNQPNLESEQSDQFSIGASWDPTEWLNITLDYFDISIENRIGFISAQSVVNRDLGISPLPIPSFLFIIRDPLTGEILEISAGTGNSGTLDEDGFDLGISTNFDFGDWGGLRTNLDVSYINTFKVDGIEQIKFAGVPEMRVGLQNVWSIGDFDLGWNVRHIGTHGSDATGDRVGGHTLNDFQLGWSAPWNAKLALGVTNATDKLPALVASGGRVFDTTLYDAYGRVPYFRYTQSF